MDTTKFLKNTVLFGLGLVAGTSTETPYFGMESNEDCMIVRNQANPSATNFNNSHKYSLEQLKINKFKLRSFTKLGSNWNNYNALEIEEAVINKVEEIISDLDFQPEIFPTGRGSIQIEKYPDDDNLVEIEISADSIFAYQVKNGTDFEGEIPSSQINAIISELYV